MFLLRKISKRQMVSAKIISKQMKKWEPLPRIQWYCTDGDLPAGKYYVKEKLPMVMWTKSRDMLTFPTVIRTPVITYDEKWQNARQKVKVTVLKKEKDTDRVLAGGVFGLYTSEDIKNARRGTPWERQSDRAASNGWKRTDYFLRQIFR